MPFFPGTRLFGTITTCITSSALLLHLYSQGGFPAQRHFCPQVETRNQFITDRLRRDGHAPSSTLKRTNRSTDIRRVPAWQRGLPIETAQLASLRLCNPTCRQCSSSSTCWTRQSSGISVLVACQAGPDSASLGGRRLTLDTHSYT